MINPEIETLYNVRAALPDHQRDFDRWANNSSLAREGLQEQLQSDLAYGPEPRQKLDLFLAPGNTPLHVFIHGGYWQALDKSFFSYLAPAFLGVGFSLAVVNYRLCPDVSLGELASDIKSALRWLSLQGGEHGYDGQKLHLSGHSAGGHLVGMMMSDRETAPLIASGVSISGLFDLQPLMSTSMNETLNLDQESAVENSPAFKSPLTDVPFLLATGELESEAFHWQSDMLAKKWQQRCHQLDVMKVAGCHHLTVIDQLGDPSSELFKAVIDRANSTV